MAKARSNGAGHTPDRSDDYAATAKAESDENVGLPAGKDEDDAAGMADDDDDDLVVHPGHEEGAAAAAAAAAAAEAAAASHRAPRTPNRVRFDLTPTFANAPSDTNGHAAANGRAGGGDAYVRDSFDVDEEDYFTSGEDGRQHRLPLLTGIEAPAVALATGGPWGRDGDDAGDADEWAEQERRRPKSGLWSAFMNMANSIIGAGIIGQPYALKQAGLLSGILLLLALTVAVDWTICLIVVNSKLSGTNSFQATVEHCFGRTGLIAISLAQWVFAFGGMVAFGVIVGDTIPHVLSAIWPGLSDVPVLGLLADRRVVIMVFILGISYPLTLYRDIAKVSERITHTHMTRPSSSNYRDSS